uniref:Anoctamin n=1 Tax=Stegastes partitus TaxID=144197 RepID=A0A3B4ZKY2_9TELE
MLRKSSELLRGDREVLLDLDTGAEAQTTDSYGSLQNGGFIPPRYAANADDDVDDPVYVHCGTRSKQPVPQPGNYFRDGRTKIFVLVWEIRSRRKRRGKGKSEMNAQEGEDAAAAAAAAEESSRSERRKAQLAQWREKFVQNLESVGLLMEKQAQPHLDLNTSARVLSRLCIPNVMKESVPSRPLDYYTCAFRKSKMSFLGCEDRETYFSNTQRHRVVYEILARTMYGKRKRAEVGVDRLVNEGAYTAAFPLHEGPFQLPKYEIRPDELNQRQVLYHYWARWCKWYKYQPLDHIREYFGEKIALYFAWLFYTAWLLPAAVVGTLIFVSGVMSMGNNTPKEICSSGASYLMCPLCKTCQAWNMSEICTMAKLGYLFDHPGTVFFSVFMSFWAVTFLEYWKRKMATLSHHWDCMDFHEEEQERPRPEFAAMAPTMEQNPVTGIKEPYFPEKTRLSRMFTGSMVIVMMLCVVMIFLVTVVMCRGIISVMMFHTGSPVLRTEAGTIANISSSIVNLGLILLMGRVYTALAEQLTKWMHRTQTQYDNAFIFKVFIFQFVNFYSSPFYVAFFKGFVGYPTNYGTLFGMRNEDSQCGPGGCLIELAEQLFIIMVGKQLINNIQEFILKVKAWRQKRTLAKVIGGKGSGEPRRWEEDYQLVECEGLFEEYLEMLQFGFITIFVAAFPLAPLFALLNNWVEIRLDAHKFVCEYRRPVAERAQNIGVWFNILEALSHLSVIANAFLIAFTSDFLPRLLYQYKFGDDLNGYVNFTLAYAPLNYTYKAFRDNNGNYTFFYWELLAVRLGFIIAFEHVVFFVLRAIDWIVPDVPESLELKIKRERYLAKQALAENQEALL